MKIRSGFVSNSSSSSFIIGIGLVRPGKEEEVAKIYGHENVESLIDMVTDDRRSKWGIPQVDGDTIRLEAFGYNSVDIRYVWNKLKELGVDDIKVVHFNESGSEPEWDDDNGSYNYDWYQDDPDAFSEDQQLKYKLLQNDRNLFIEGDVKCGAGYDG